MICSRALTEHALDGIHDDMNGIWQPFDQALRLWAVTGLSGRNCDAKRQAKSINGNVDLGG